MFCPNSPILVATINLGVTNITCLVEGKSFYFAQICLASFGTGDPAASVESRTEVASSGFAHIGCLRPMSARFLPLLPVDFRLH